MLISYLCSIIKGRVPRTRLVSENGRGRRAFMYSLIRTKE